MRTLSYLAAAIVLLAPPTAQASPVVSRINNLKELAAKGIEISVTKLDDDWEYLRNVIVKWAPNGREAKLLKELEKDGFELWIQIRMITKGDDQSPSEVVYRSDHRVEKDGVATTVFECTVSAKFDVILTFGDIDNFGSYVSLKDYLAGFPDAVNEGPIDSFEKPIAKPE